MTRELPIIFNSHSVRSILAGTKTKTRRVVAPSNSTVNGSGVRASSPAWSGLRLDEARARTRTTLELAMFGDKASLDPHLDAPWDHPNDRPGLSGCVFRVRPKFEPGDTLWVKETWARVEPYPASGEDYGLPDGDYIQSSATLLAYWRRRIVHRADLGDGADPPPDSDGRWRPSIFMPKWATRLWLRVEAVRVERLQEISEEDAKAEGVGVGFWVTEVPGRAAPLMTASCRASFACEWDEINSKRAPWAADPWVWIITFSRLEEAPTP